MTKQIKTVLLLVFVFFNVSSKAQWIGGWNCSGSGTPNPNAPITIQNVGSQFCARVNATGNNCGWLFTSITGTSAICVPDNFSVTAMLQNPDNVSEYDTHLILMDGNPGNPNYFVAQMRVDGDGTNGSLQFANVGVNNTIPPCCTQEITSLIFPQIRTTWTAFTIQVNGTQVRYFLNGTPVTDNNGQVIVQTLTNAVCSIIPKLYFKGSGLVDDLLITDNNTSTTIYHESFNSLQFAQAPTCPSVTINPTFTGPDCSNNNLQLFANPAPGQTYSYAWSGPNGFTSNLENPVIPNPTSAEVGSYTVVATLNGWNCTSSSQQLNVSFEEPDCTNCSDTCYWKVTGNNIINNRNILGTLTNDNIRIFSSSQQRGLISADGYFGWQTIPTTYFHLNCTPPVSVFQIPSGLRLENVPRGFGDALVIDGNGYVFRQRSMVLEFSQKIDSLENEITALRSLVTTSKSGNIEKQSSQSTLSQNKPNPFSDITTIDCFVAQMKSNAFVAIYDLTGKELMKFRLGGKGRNSIQVNSNNLADGMYIYALIIDGEEVASKKMVISKQ